MLSTTYRAKNVMKSLTVRTVCKDMWLMFMLSHILRLAIIVTKSSSVWIVCSDMWPMFMKMGSSCIKIKPKLNINPVIVACLQVLGVLSMSAGAG